MSHLTDTVKRLEKEKDAQAVEIKKMKGFANFFLKFMLFKGFLNGTARLGWHRVSF